LTGKIRFEFLRVLSLNEKKMTIINLLRIMPPYICIVLCTLKRMSMSARSLVLSPAQVLRDCSSGEESDLPEAHSDEVNPDSRFNCMFRTLSTS
jgi:hypothetical protein